MSVDNEKREMSFFVDEHLELMRSILDRIIPPFGSFPGAGELDLVSYIDQAIGQSAELKRLFASGMAEIVVKSERLAHGGFIGLSGEQQDEILRQIESEFPVFFRFLLHNTYCGYYINPKIVELLGLELRSPQPEGYGLESSDLSLLENVKKRGQIYRNVHV